MKLKKFGTIHKVDMQGYLIPVANKSKITPLCEQAIKVAVAAWEKHASELVHSIYLRGSYALGEEVEGFSDLDFCILVKKQVSEDLVRKIVQDVQEKSRKIKSLKPEFFEFTVDYVSCFDPDHKDFSPTLAAKLKLTALHLSGQNILPELPNVKPGRQTLFNAPYLHKVKRRYLEEYKAWGDEKFWRRKNSGVRWYSKIILRAGAEIAAERDQSYTRAAYKCYEIFSEYYPEKQEDMAEILKYFVSPPLYPSKKFLSITSSMVDFILRETNKYYPIR